MSKCEKCGLYLASDNECFWFKKKLTPEDLAASDECIYFIQIICEDGEPLTPQQHYIFKQNELASKKMRIN